MAMHLGRVSMFTYLQQEVFYPSFILFYSTSGDSTHIALHVCSSYPHIALHRIALWNVHIASEVIDFNHFNKPVQENFDKRDKRKHR
jgi:hypothetical protein